MKIFLSGNISKISGDTLNSSWVSTKEEEIKAKIKADVEIINPNSMILPNFDGTRRFSVDITALLECDIVILDAVNKCGIGVGAELVLAKQYNIPVFTISPLNSHYHKIINNREWIHSFLCELSDQIFDNLDDLCIYINYLCNRGLLLNNQIQNAKDITDKLVSFDGGYDEGYIAEELFWGEKPATGVVKVASFFEDSHRSKISVLDAGCGHGKNSVFLSNKGFIVDAFDSSFYAIKEARKRNKNVNWRICDIRKFNSESKYNVIIMTGSLHCLHSKEEIIKVIKKMQSFTEIGGYNVLSSFNDKYQDLSGHPKSFNPTLLSHNEYIEIYKEWKIIEESSDIQDDIHPNNNIKHKHSITRILAQKIK